jgi:fucose 4-O-acetylase-like acetyltransferase
VIYTLQYVAVPVFFICAGLAMSPKARSPSRLVGEATNYLYVYLVWVLISFVLTAFITQANFALPASAAALLKLLFFPAGPLWFPYGLALMLASNAVLARWDRRLRLALAFAGGFVPLIPVLQKDIITAVCGNAFCFYAGLLFRPEITGFLSKPRWQSCAVPTAAYAALLAGAGWAGLIDLPPVYDALTLLGFLAVVSFWQLQPISALSCLMAKLGRAALPILLLHDFWLHVGDWMLMAASPTRLVLDWEPVTTASLSAFALLMSLATFRVIGRTKAVFSAPRHVVEASSRTIRELWYLLPSGVRRFAAISSDDHVTNDIAR